MDLTEYNQATDRLIDKVNQLDQFSSDIGGLLVDHLRASRKVIQACMDSTPTPNPDPPTPDPTPPARTNNVGMNMIGAHSWDWFSIFRNAFLETRWVTEYRGSQYINDIPLDGDGWPAVSIPHDGKKLFGTVEINAHTPIVGGRPFTLVQYGPSQIKIAGVGLFVNLGSGLSSEVRFPAGTESVNVVIESADPRSMWELIYPGEQEHVSSEFHSSTLNSLKPFGIIRFMDWTKTNGSTQVRWSDSNNFLGMSESSDTGSSWANAIRLARDTRSDMWINIPHGADANYVLRLSELMSAFQGNRLFVEYSNECWNPGSAFRPQYDFCRKHGEKEFNYDNFLKNLAVGYGDLANKNFEIFTVNYTGSAKVEYVAAWQSAATWTTEYVLDACPAATAIAHAPYVYDSNWKSDSLDQIFQDMNGANGEGLIRCRQWLRRYENLARGRGLQHMIYECGNHTGGGDNVELSYQVASDPRLTEVLVEFDALVNEIAGDIPRCYFTLGGKDRRGYAFGHQSHSGDTDDVKWQALMRILGVTS